MRYPEEEAQDIVDELNARAQRLRSDLQEPEPVATWIDVAMVLGACVVLTLIVLWVWCS